MVFFAKLIDLLVAALFVAMLPYFLFVLTTALAAFFRRRTGGLVKGAATPPSSPHARFLVAIPAHDEESVITATVRSARALDYPAELFEVLVIADNCTDGTAELARAAGARVVERADATRKSKGYAIEFLIDALQRSGEFDAIDAIVIVDADSTLHPQLLRTFERGLDAGDDWIQAYDTVGNADQSWRTGLMAYSFSLINGVLLQGLTALGLSASLRGNGMCLSTRGLRRAPWRTYGLTEDLEYSWRLRLNGERIAFDRDAVVYATMPSQGGNASVTQRRRWEHGRRELRWKMFAPLLASPHGRPLEKIFAAIELTMPPMVSLIGLFVLMACVASVRIPVILARQEYVLGAVIATSFGIAMLGFLVLTLSPFLLAFLPWRISRSLLYFPYYAAWKLFVVTRGRPTAWVRTAREPLPSGLNSRGLKQFPHVFSRGLVRPVRGKKLEI